LTLRRQQLQTLADGVPGLAEALEEGPLFFVRCFQEPFKIR
jgi:hypothetical protein